MKKIFTKYILGIGLIFMSFSSCTNLDEKVYSDLPGDGFLTTEDALLMNAGRAYVKLQNYPAEQTLWTLTESASDELAIPTRHDGSWNNQGRWKQIQEHNIDPTNTILSKAWAFTTEGISACNEIIYITEQSPIEFEGKNKILAEIRILRALYYFWLTDGWGNVPFSIDYSDVSLPQQKDRAFVAEFIEKEIKENIDALDAEANASNYGRVTKSMANMLLAKLYMNWEAWFGTPRYNEAIACCDAIINTGDYTIEDNFFSNFKVDNTNSKENIFVIPYDEVLTRNKFYWYTLSLNDDSRSSFNFVGSMWDGFVCQPDFFTLYDDNDARKKSFLYGQQYDKTGNPLVIRGKNFIYSPTVANYDSRQAWEGARICKYEYQEGLEYGYTNMANDFVLFRYADVLYTKLEALWRSNGNVSEFLSNPELQKIRTRAGMPVYTVSDITAQELLNEFGREFAWEGRRRQDLIRFDKWGASWWSKPASNPNKELFPIPKTALDANSNLSQNPL